MREKLSQKLWQNGCSNIISLWKREVLFEQFMGQPWFTKEKIGICTKMKSIEK